MRAQEIPTCFNFKGFFHELFEKKYHVCRAHCWKRSRELHCSFQMQEHTAVVQNLCAPQPRGAYSTSVPLLPGEMTASLKPWVSYQSLGMCSPLYFTSSCMAALNPEEQTHKRLNLTCEADPETSALWAVRLWWVFHLPVLLHLDKGTDQSHVVNAHYASVGTVSLQLSDICFPRPYKCAKLNFIRWRQMVREIVLAKLKDSHANEEV